MNALCITAGSPLLAMILPSPPHLLHILVCSKDSFWPVPVIHVVEINAYRITAYWCLAALNLNLSHTANRE